MSGWRFPWTPGPPHWELDWEGLLARLGRWLEPMGETIQDPIWHAEGDVLLHTRMVCEALVALEEWRELDEEARNVSFVAALLHDVGKPATTAEEDGRILARGHARLGQSMSREILYMAEECRDFRPGRRVREQIAGLVRHHGVPLWAIEDEGAAFRLHSISQAVSMPQLALVAEADVRGRTCEDQEDLLSRVELFRELCREEACWEGPRAFATEVARHVYLGAGGEKPASYVPHEDFACEVTMLSGLPAAGKDHWVRTHAGERPVVHLDGIRARLGVDPGGDQGPVVQAAREEAKQHLRAGRDFVWNATNTTRSLRSRLLDLFARYGARLRLVYLEAPWEELLRRNRARERPVPEAVLRKLARKLEVPGFAEAHHVEWLESGGDRG